MNPILLLDSYKLGHAAQYPKGTERVYSNFTPRSSKHFRSPVKQTKVVFFGLQAFLMELKEMFDRDFFAKPKLEILNEVADTVGSFVGPSGFDLSRIADLHDLGYLPLRVKAIAEGSRVNIGVPVFTIVNTIPEFYWLTNYFETLISAELWKPTTSATIAYEYRRILEMYAESTGAPLAFVDWQAHDFSMRGMSGFEDAAKSGSGHLLSFTGSDTIPAVLRLKKYYKGDETFIAGSVPATEHSVMCAGGFEDEISTFRRLINDLYPAGIVSIVSDTWDFWQVITNYSVQLKNEILSRTPDGFGNAKVVFRPDSGDPIRILTGYTNLEIRKQTTPDGMGMQYFCNKTGKELMECEVKGAVECLWDIFGGTETAKGYKILDSHVGLIYGDSITLERASSIMNRLKLKGFASCNVVLGVGSYTYQFNTRDTFGFAMKSTYVEINGVGKEIFKSPKTDDGTKNSACGLLRVEKKGEDYVLYDKQTWQEEGEGELRTVFFDGNFVNVQSLAEIRLRLLG